MAEAASVQGGRQKAARQLGPGGQGDLRQQPAPQVFQSQHGEEVEQEALLVAGDTCEWTDEVVQRDSVLSGEPAAAAATVAD